MNYRISFLGAQCESTQALSRRHRLRPLDRIIIETTGLADLGPVGAPNGWEEAGNFAQGERKKCHSWSVTSRKVAPATGSYLSFSYGLARTIDVMAPGGGSIPPRRAFRVSRPRTSHSAHMNPLTMELSKTPARNSTTQKHLQKPPAQKSRISSRTNRNTTIGKHQHQKMPNTTGRIHKARAAKKTAARPAENTNTIAPTAENTSSRKHQRQTTSSRKHQQQTHQAALLNSFFPTLRSPHTQVVTWIVSNHS